MDSILENYVSSPSPSTTPTLLSPPCVTASFDRAIKQRLVNIHQYQTLLCRRSTREEDTFAFRGYVAKRRRRHIDTETKSFTAMTHSITSEMDCESLNNQRNKDTLDIQKNSWRKKLLRNQNRHQFIGHTKAVNELQWHPKNPFIFISASMDATVRLWSFSVIDEHEKSSRKLLHHFLGVTNAKWSQDGQQILSGGYDGIASCVDAETGQVQLEIRRSYGSMTCVNVERITTVHYHPTELYMVLLGTDKGYIYCHDLRVKSAVIATYTQSFGDVHDLLFLDDTGQRFVSSAGVKQRDASNQTLLVWDWRSATLLYDRLDNNMLAHTCLRKHPYRPYFVAQCSGNYATLYSLRAPYKCVKGPSVNGRCPPLCFKGSHEVEGYKVRSSFSRDGTVWASGDARGRVVLYRASGKRELAESCQLYGRNTACICAEFQPLHNEGLSMLLTGSENGNIDLFWY